MSYTTITSISACRDYIKTRLGDPVVCVEISDDQLNEIIFDSIQDFTRYNYGEGSYKDYVVLSLSADVSEYNLSGTNIIDTIDYTLSTSDGGSINALFTPTHIALSETGIIQNVTSNGMVDWNIAMLMLEEIKNTFNKMFMVDFRQGSNIMRVVPTPTEAYTGILTCYKKETALNLYNNRLVQRLCVARAKIQWVEHLSKYSLTLPGGGTMNGDSIISRGKEEEEKVMEDIKGESEPTDFFVG